MDSLTPEFACFGAAIANYAEQGIIFPDLSPENVGILDERLRIHDFDCMEEYPFPGDPHVYATALFSFLGYIPTPDAAAFRFGYIHWAGRFGRIIFDRLHHDFGLTPWADPQQIPDIPRLDETGWAESHHLWVKRRDALDLPDLDEGAWLFRSLLRPENISETAQTFRDSDPDIAFHALERRLIIEAARNDQKQFLYVISEIGLLAAELGDKLRAGLWGLTIQAFQKDLREERRLWPHFMFWLPWTAEETMREVLRT